MLRTAAAKRLDELVYVFLSVVVRNLLTFFDGAGGKDKHAVAVNLCLCIRPARMINVASLIPLRLTVNRIALLDLKKIPALARFLFFWRHAPSHVFNNALTFWYGFTGKKSKAGS